MSSFRNSSVPEWAANENNGYFQSRTSGGVPNPPRDPQSGGQSNPSRTSFWNREMCLPKSPAKASTKLKDRRVMFSVRDIYCLQVILFISIFLMFPMDLVPANTPQQQQQRKDATNLAMAVGTCYAAIVCLPGFLFLFTLYLTLNMFAILMTNSDKSGPTIQHQINRCSSFRFLMKPFLLVCFIMAHYNYLLQLFDTKYKNIFRSKMSPNGCKPKEECYFIEENLVLRIVVSLAALEFFVGCYSNAIFSLKFASVPVSRYMFGLFDFSQIVKCTRASILFASCVGFVCLVFGPVFYCPAFYMLGYKMWETRLLERVFLFLNVGFLIRLYVYTILTRTLLPMLLRLVNHRLTGTVNFHVEETSGHHQCLVLSEAMACDRKYLKMLAFYEYSFKTDTGNTDLSVFFKTTHPGNRPQTWRNLFNASVRVMILMNECVVIFLKGSKMPASFLQSGLGPYILHQLRERETINQRNTAPAAPAEIPRVGNMRDLTSSNRPDFPNQIPTITEAVRQNLELLWNDFKAGVTGFFSVQTLNNALFGGKLDCIIPENVISNILSDHLLSYWAIMGSAKLMCASVTVDVRGVVNPDIKPFLIKILETYDIMTGLELYITKVIDVQEGINKKLSDNNKEITSKMASACVFVLAKLDGTFSSCYSILDIGIDLQNRIQEILSSRERP